MEVDFMRFVLLDSKYGIRLGEQGNAPHYSNSMQCWRGHLFYTVDQCVHVARIDSATVTGQTTIRSVAKYINDRAIVGLRVNGNTLTVYDEKGWLTIGCADLLKSDIVDRQAVSKVSIPGDGDLVVKRVTERVVLSESGRCFERVGLTPITHASSIVDVDGEYGLDKEGVWQLQHGDTFRLVACCAVPGFEPISLHVLNGEKRMFAVGFGDGKEYNLVVTSVDVDDGTVKSHNLGNLTGAFVETGQSQWSGHYSVHYFNMFGDNVDDLMIIAHSQSIRLAMAGRLDHGKLTALDISMDEYTADMPMSDDCDDTFPVDMVVDLHNTFQYKVPDDRVEVLEYPPGPIVLARTTDNRLVPFAVVNTKNMQLLPMMEPLEAAAVEASYNDDSPSIIPGYMVSSPEPSNSILSTASLSTTTFETVKGTAQHGEEEEKTESMEGGDKRDEKTAPDLVVQSPEDKVVSQVAPKTPSDHESGNKEPVKPVKIVFDEPVLTSVSAVDKSPFAPLFNFNFGKAAVVAADVLVLETKDGDKTDKTDNVESAESAEIIKTDPVPAIAISPTLQKTSKPQDMSPIPQSTQSIASAQPLQPAQSMVSAQPLQPAQSMVSVTKPQQESKPIQPTIPLQATKPSQAATKPASDHYETINFNTPKQNTIIKAFLDMHHQHHKNVTALSESVGELQQLLTRLATVDVQAAKALLEKKEKNRQHLAQSFEQLQRLSGRVSKLRQQMRQDRATERVFAEHGEALEEKVDQLVSHYKACRVASGATRKSVVDKAQHKLADCVDLMNECMSECSVVDDDYDDDNNTADHNKWSDLKKVLGRRRVEMRSISGTSSSIKLSSAAVVVKDKKDLMSVGKMAPLPRFSNAPTGTSQTVPIVENAAPPVCLPVPTSPKQSVPLPPSEPAISKPVIVPSTFQPAIVPSTMAKQEEEAPSLSTLSFGSSSANQSKPSLFSLPPITTTKPEKEQPMESPLPSPMVTPSRPPQSTVPSLPSFGAPALSTLPPPLHPSSATQQQQQSQPSSNTFKFGQSSGFTPVVPNAGAFNAPSSGGFAAFASTTNSNSGGFAAFANPTNSNSGGFAAFANTNSNNTTTGGFAAFAPPPQSTSANAKSSDNAEQKAKLLSSFTQFRG